MDVPLPAHDAHAVEGASLVPILDAFGERRAGVAEEGEGVAGGAGAGAKAGAKAWVPKPALTQYPRCPRQPSEADGWEKNSCIHSTDRADFGWMGYSMLLDHTDGHSYRFTMWPRWDGALLAPDWSDVRAVELYNHSAPRPSGCPLSNGTCSEFDWHEAVNVYNGGAPYWQPPAEHSVLVQELARVLKTSFGFGG
jgi:hypothetical protein